MSKSELSSRERLLTALSFKPVDRLPFAPLIDNYFVSSLPEQGYNMEIIEAMKYIGCDIIERHIPTVEMVQKNLDFRVEQKGETTRVYLDTPVGTIFLKQNRLGRLTL